jgi:phenylacetic acid degradation operon negative regulatory protein
MKWQTLHHPDISLPVLKRKAGQELITLLAGTSELLLSGGRSTAYSKCYPNNQAFLASAKRLQKLGLISISNSTSTLPEIRLTSAATNALPPYYTPNKYWDKRWNQWWYILMFDVPEKNRSYRNTLRKFLKTLRCGCLQKSVWVTPVDIRPEYDDLNRAVAVDSVAFLFEAKTVLGFGNQSVVIEAWDFDKIGQIQDLYIRTATENLAQLQAANSTEEETIQLLQIDNQAYAQAMLLDPLLPRELHPDGYKGETVFKIHSTLAQHAVKKFSGL